MALGGNPAAGVGRAQLRGDAAPLAGGHRLDHGPGFGPHRQPVEPFDGPVVERRCAGFRVFEKLLLPDPHRSGISAPLHQAAVAFRSAPEGSDASPAEDPFAVAQRKCRIGVESDPALRGVPCAARRVAPGSDRSVGHRVALPLDGKSLHGDLAEGCHAARYGHLRGAELCGGEARREEHRRGGRTRTQEQRHNPCHDESPCEKPQGQFVTGGQRNPCGEGRKELDHRHAVEPGEEAGGFHACKIQKYVWKCCFFPQKSCRHPAPMPPGLTSTPRAERVTGRPLHCGRQIRRPTSRRGGPSRRVRAASRCFRGSESRSACVW